MKKRTKLFKGQMKVNSFSPRKRASDKRMNIIIPIALALFLLFAFTMLISINPFQTGNPLASEATIGENVIGSWQYDGENAEGKIVFYNGYESVAIPADSKTFAANGEFVVIDAHTPDTITYESAIDSQLLNPLSLTAVVLILLFFFAVPFGVMRANRRIGMKRARRAHPFHVRPRKRA